MNYMVVSLPVSKQAKINSEQPEIAGVTYGGIMHRFTTDHAVRAYCTQVLGGYQGHACLADGSTWIPVPLASRVTMEHGDIGVTQIGWNR